MYEVNAVPNRTRHDDVPGDAFFVSWIYNFQMQYKYQMI